MELSWLAIWPVLLAFVLALVLTPLVRALAVRWGMIAHPKMDRWHNSPTALLGGVAIFVSVETACLLLMPYTRQTLAVLGGSAFLWLLGLTDDLWHLKPYQKLIGQIVGATMVVALGLVLPWTPAALVNVALTIFWVVGITNAVNLLDNMDGLAAGVATIAAVFLGIHFAGAEEWTVSLMLAAFAAALVGFLIYNAQPASIFMGDCGSMFIGFFLASSVLLDDSGTGGRSQSVLPVLAVPVLIFLIPIFDTTLVLVLRKLAGRSPAQGGRDHVSHRLVALGLSERRAVWLLYALATLAGLLSLLVRHASLAFSLAAIVTCTVGLTLIGVYLAGVKVYGDEEVRAVPLAGFLVDLSYKRRIFEVLLDVLLIILAFYAASGFAGGPVLESWQPLLSALPLLVSIQMASFLALGVYRGLWRYLRLPDLLTYVKAVVIGATGSALAIAILFRAESWSPAVFVVDALVLFVLVSGSRLAFRLVHSLLPSPMATGSDQLGVHGPDVDCEPPALPAAVLNPDEKSALEENRAAKEQCAAQAGHAGL